MPDQELPLAFPVHGLDVSNDIELQPKGTTPTGNNVRAFEAATQRERGASRPGLAKYIAAQAGGSALIQDIDSVVTASPAAVSAGSAGADGTQMLADFAAGNFIFRALQVQSGFSSITSSGSATINNPLPHPPIYPRDSPNQFVVYLSGTDNNGNPVLVGGSANLRVPFTGQLASTSYPVTPTDYLASTYTLNGAVFQVKNGVEVAATGMNFSFTLQSTWKLPFFAVLGSGNTVWGKDNSHHSGNIVGSRNDAMLSAFATSTPTVRVTFPVDNGGNVHFADLGWVEYTAPNTFTSGTAAVLGIAYGAFACCTDGTDFYAVGISSTGGTFISRVKGDGSGTVLWSNSNAGPYSGTAPSPTAADQTTSRTQGAACCAANGVLYVYLPQYGVSSYQTSNGTALGTIIQAAQISAGAGGYQSQAQGANVIGLSMVYCNGYLAIPIQDQSWGFTAAKMGIVFVNVTTKAVSGVPYLSFGANPTWLPLVLAVDSTHVYAMSGPQYIGGNASEVILAKLNTDGTVVWRTNPFVAGAMGSPNYVCMTYLSGSQQILAGNPNETVVVSAADGSVTRRLALAYSSPRWFTDAGAA